MAKATTKPKKTGGSKSMLAAGRKLIWVTATPAQLQQIRGAAGLCGKPMSQFVLGCALAAAEKTLGKFANAP